MFTTTNQAGNREEHWTLEEAFKHFAEGDSTVWKISFSVGSERIRLILTSEGWTYEDAFGSRKYKDDLLHSAPAKIYTTGRIDLANIIAKETSGVRSATPEQSDFELADKFLDEISNRKDL